MSLFYPLNEFYEQAGLPQPVVTPVEGRDMPEPYRSLLVHGRDMTPTLEEAYGRKIELRVLRYTHRENVFSREIVLVLQGDETAVEFGAIKIYLEHFPPQARSLILEMKQPLGSILHSQGIAHMSRPNGYFEVNADLTMRSALRLTGENVLYGRRNAIFDPARNTLARVLEILPPPDIRGIG